MFAESGDAALNASVATSAVEGAKTTGDFDSDLHHAESPSGFVVRKEQLQRPPQSKDGPQIAGEEVMHEPTGEPGEDADGLPGLLAAVEMNGEEGF